MQRQFSTENHKLLLERATEYVCTNPACNNGIFKGPHTDTFKWVRRIGYLASAANIFFFTVYMLGCWLQLTDIPNAKKDSLAAVRSGLTLTAVCTAVIVGAIILYRLRKPIIASVMSVVAGVPMMLHMFSELDWFTDKKQLLLTHVLPISVMIIASIYLLISAIIYKNRVSGRYSKIVSDIYKSRPSDGTIMTESEWGELIAGYINKPEHKKKRSQRKKEQKDTDSN